MDGKVTERQDSKSKVTIQPTGISFPKFVMIFKFNGGNGAFLCSRCRKILYTLSTLPTELYDKGLEMKNKYGQPSWEKLPDIYCKDCEKSMKTFENLK